MPSGYTCQILEDKVTDLKGFATICARAFGATIMQRDDPLDAPLKMPEPDTSYYEGRIKEGEAELKRLENLSHEDRTVYGVNKQNEKIKYCQEGIERVTENLNKLNKVLAEVVKWTPPTPAHTNFKEFMIDQIRETVRFDGDSSYYFGQLEEVKNKNPQSYYNEALEDLKRSIENSKKYIKEEIERANGRREWLTSLLDSLN